MPFGDRDHLIDRRALIWAGYFLSFDILGVIIDRVGVARQTLLATENGKFLPTLELAFRIAKTFGVGLDEIFTCQEE